MVTKRDPETSPAAFLGNELRRARVAAGFSSQDALAARLGFDRTVITKAETGLRPPTADVLAAWCAACGLDQDMFGRLGALARRADGSVPPWFQDWVQDIEATAVTLRWFEPLIVPGLLQTEAYARALYATRVALSTDDVDALVSRPDGPAGDPDPRGASNAVGHPGRGGASPPGRRRVA